MIRLRLKSGFRSAVKGEPERRIITAPRPERVAAVPEREPFVKPRLLVHENDTVAIGTPLYEDKRNPQIRFLSPGGGQVEQIQFGPRRIIQAIVIRLSEEEEQKSFTPVTSSELAGMSRQECVALLSEAGLWPMIRQLPFRDYAALEGDLPLILVALKPGDMYSVLPGIYLDNEESDFLFGLSIMRKLAKKVYVAAPENEISYLDPCMVDTVTHVTENNYPAGDPGVIVYQIKTDPGLNQAAYISGQDLVGIGKFLRTGLYPVEKIVSVAGSSASRPVHMFTRTGVSLESLTSIESNGKRLITGGVFNGFDATETPYLGFLESSVAVLEGACPDEFFGYLNPGMNKLSESSAFVSALNRKKPRTLDSHLHGEERACINCGYCSGKCPVDLFPQFIMKAHLADELEEMLALGLLDCTGCGLCSYVCPSKIELAESMEQAQAAYYKDRGRA